MKYISFSKKIYVYVVLGCFLFVATSIITTVFAAPLINADAPVLQPITVEGKRTFSITNIQDIDKDDLRIAFYYRVDRGIWRRATISRIIMLNAGDDGIINHAYPPAGTSPEVLIDNNEYHVRYYTDGYPDIMLEWDAAEDLGRVDYGENAEFKFILRDIGDDVLIEKDTGVFDLDLAPFSMSEIESFSFSKQNSATYGGDYIEINTWYQTTESREYRVVRDGEVIRDWSSNNNSVDVGIEPGRTYTYQAYVRDSALNVSGPFTQSYTVPSNFNNSDVRPPYPVNIQAFASPSAIEIEWELLSDAGGQVVHMFDENNELIFSTDNPYLTYKALRPGQTYTFYLAVRYSGTGLYSPYSPPIVITTTESGSDTAIVEPPTWVAAEVIDNTTVDISFEWFNFLTYRIYLDGVLHGVYDAKDPNYRISGLTPKESYSVTVRAYDGYAESADSDILNFTMPATLPSNPTGVSVAAAAPTVIEVQWDATDGIDYKIYLDGTLTKTITSDGVETAYLDKLVDGDTYNVRITAVNSVGESGGVTRSITLPAFEGGAVTVPAPTGVEATLLDSGNILITWTADETLRYAVYSNDVRITDYVLGDNSHTVTDVSVDTRYEFKVQASNGDIGSDFSDTVVVVTSAEGGGGSEGSGGGGGAPADGGGGDSSSSGSSGGGSDESSVGSETEERTVRADGCRILEAGDLLRIEGSSAIYVVDSERRVHSFSRPEQLFSWGYGYEDVYIEDRRCASYYNPLPTRIPSREYSYGLVKIDVAATIYVLALDGSMYAIQSPADAVALWGGSWEYLIRQFPLLAHTSYPGLSSATALDITDLPNEMLVSYDGAYWLHRDGEMHQITDEIPDYLEARAIQGTASMMSTIATETFVLDDILDITRDF